MYIYITYIYVYMISIRMHLFLCAYARACMFVGVCNGCMSSTFWCRLHAPYLYRNTLVA